MNRSSDPMLDTLPTGRVLGYGARAMFPSRRARASAFALVAFLLALVPATSSARAQLVRWAELDADPAVKPSVGVRVVRGTRAGKFYQVWLHRRSDVERARFVGRDGEVSLMDRLREQDQRLLEIPIELLNSSPGWVAVDLRPIDAEWSPDVWRDFLASEVLLDVVRPDDKPVRVRRHQLLKVLVHRGSASSEAVTRPVGQALEVVPLVDPLQMGGNLLPVRVLFRGKPLVGARVYASCVDAFSSSSATTDAEGKGVLKLEGMGSWILAAAKVESSQTGFEIFTSRNTVRRR
jgi:hypothetical protein